MKNEREKRNEYISAVVYVHGCDVQALMHFCERILKPMKDSFENMETIFVIDGHQEVDQEKIRNILTEISVSDNASVIQFPFFQGIEAGLCAGDDLSVGDFVVEFDSVIADFGYELVEKVFEIVKTGYDIVSAGTGDMKLTSKLFYSLINHGRREKIHHETFRVVSRRALNRIKILNKTVPYRKMLYATCGLPSTFIKYTPEYAGAKRHKEKLQSYHLDSGFKYMIIFTNVIEKMTMFLSMIFLLAAVGTGIWAVYDHFFGNDIAGGWVSLMAVISFGFFGLFLLVMVVIKYLSLLIDANYKKADYVVERTEKI